MATKAISTKTASRKTVSAETIPRRFNEKRKPVKFI